MTKPMIITSCIIGGIMDNKQIEMPKKKTWLAPTDYEDDMAIHEKIGYNLCHDEFTAWLVGRMGKVKETVKLAIRKWYELPYPERDMNNINNFIATAIKTMIMGGKE